MSVETLGEHPQTVIEYVKKRRYEGALTSTIATELNAKGGVGDGRQYNKATISGITNRHIPEYLNDKRITLPGPFEFLPEGCKPAYRV
jgi:hypothetical protein